jgi:hypothetical protein
VLIPSDVETITDTGQEIALPQLELQRGQHKVFWSDEVKSDGSKECPYLSILVDMIKMFSSIFLNDFIIMLPEAGMRQEEFG